DGGTCAPGPVKWIRSSVLPTAVDDFTDPEPVMRMPCPPFSEAVDDWAAAEAPKMSAPLRPFPEVVDDWIVSESPVRAMPVLTLPATTRFEISTLSAEDATTPKRNCWTTPFSIVTPS